MKTLKSFSQYIVESKKEITVAWGRTNPPTVGHEKLFDATRKAASGGDYKIYVSQSQDAKKNPLDYNSKVKYLRKMFPRHARNIMLDTSVKTFFDLLTMLYNQGYNSITFVAGSDRVPEYQALLSKYNGVRGRHGFYNFENINVVSAGERDPDSEGVTGMSASKLRQAAADNDFQLFMRGMPSGFKEAKDLFNDVRKGMGLNESHSFRKHIQLESISEEREAYVAGDLFNVGEEVLVKEMNMPATILYLGTNHVVLMDENENKFKKWIHQLEKLNESEVDRVKARAEREKERTDDQLERDLERAKEIDDREAELEKEQEQERLEREKEERERRQQRQESIRYILKAIQEK